MYSNSFVMFHNSNFGYGNNGDGNNGKFDRKPPNGSPSNGNVESGQHIPPRVNNSKKWTERWHPRNPRNNADSSSRQRRDREPQSNQGVEDVRTGAKPKVKPNSVPVQQQQQLDQQQVGPVKEADDAMGNQADKKEKDDGGHGPTNDSEECKVQNKPASSQRPNGDRAQHGNKQYGQVNGCDDLSYDDQCHIWLNKTHGRKQSNNYQKNYGTSSSHSLPTPKHRHNGYRQWENSTLQKNNNSTRSFNPNNTFHQNNRNYTPSGRNYNERPRNQEVTPYASERTPQALQYPQTLIPFLPSQHVSAGIFALQQFASEMEYPSDYTPEGLCNGSKWDQLSEDIWAKFLKHQQKREVLCEKIDAWGSFYNSMKQICPEFVLITPDRNTHMDGAFGLYLVGSTYTGFGLNTSDVDTCLMISNQELGNYYHSVTCLQRIRDSLAVLEIAGGVDVDCNTLTLIPAKVPILKFMEKKWNVHFDVNCNNSVGVRNTHLLFHYCQIEWRLRPLVILVKVWAKFHGINEAKDMTLSSYSLTLMVIHYLQCGAVPAVLPCLQKLSNRFDQDQPLNVLSVLNFPYERQNIKPFASRNCQSLGKLLVGFFQYFATFDFGRDAISVRLGSIVPTGACRNSKAPKNDPSQWKFISIEEPFELTNTARAVFDANKFVYIIEVFRHTAKILSETERLESIFEPFVPASQAATSPTTLANTATNLTTDTAHRRDLTPASRK